MSKMKILVLDIETAPHVVYSWGLFNQNHPIDRIVEPGRVIMFSAKWVGKPGMHTYTENDEGVGNREEGQRILVARAFELFEEADAIIGYNVAGFDIKWLHGQMVKHGYEPPAAHKVIDLLKTVRGRFRLASNKLDYVAQYLGLGSKLAHSGFDLWKGWEQGREKDINKMVKYCEQDVKLTERLYYKLRPWISDHPNHALYNPKGRPSCTNCGSTKVVKKGQSYTRAGIYQRFKCLDCGTPLRGNTMTNSLEERRQQLRPEK